MKPQVIKINIKIKIYDSRSCDDHIKYQAPELLLKERKIS